MKHLLYRFLPFILPAILFICLLPLSLSGTEENSKPQQQSQEAQAEDNDIRKMVCKARCCNKVDNDPFKADSILRAAIRMAELSYDNNIILSTYNDYIECMEPGQFETRRVDYAKKMLDIINFTKDEHLLWRSYYNLAGIYQFSYQKEKSLEFSYKSFNLADKLKDDTLKALSYISIGKSVEKSNNKIEEFRNYLQALNLAEKSENERLLDHCFSQLSRFYSFSKNYEKAIEYKLKQGALLRKQSPPDSLKLMYNQFELEEINYSSNRDVNENSIWMILRYARVHKDDRLKEFTLSLYRSYLINTEKFDKLSDFYTLSYPRELKALAKQNPVLYFRVKALIAEYKSDTDSAFFYFSEADKLIEKDINPVFKANFYIRYGQFYKRQHKNKEAMLMFEKAYQLASSSSLDYAIKASRELESAYEVLGDYHNAFHYARLTHVLSDSLSKLTKRDDLLLMEIDNAARQREDAKARELLETERRHKIQYTAMVVLMVGIFVILIVLGSLRVPRWTIELLGFVSFIFLFEFIVLIADNFIHRITHGEPWKILAIKIVLIGFLMPLHHLVEKRMVIYLLNKKLIRINKNTVRRFFHEMFSHDEHTDGIL